MATTFNTRIQNKIDTYQNWFDNNPTPLNGEVCVVIVPTGADVVAQEPAVLFKVGNGTDDFKTLPFASAIASDVHDWAKNALKPEYEASEINGLAAFIATEIEDTDTQYKLEQDGTDGHVIKLSSKGLKDADWTVIATITTVDTVYNDAELRGRIEANENAIGVLNGTGAGSVSKQVMDAIAAVVAGAPDSYDTLIEISTWITEHADSAAAMNAKIQSNESDIGALEALVGSTAVATQIADAIAALDLGNVYATAAALSDLASRVSDTETDIESLDDDLADLDGRVTQAEADILTKANATETTTALNLKANAADLATVATSGDIKDLSQTAGDYVVFYCGTSSVLV